MPPADFSKPISSRLAKSPDVVMVGRLPDAASFVARARLLGARIETRDVGGDAALGALAQGTGLSFVFRYGVVVTIGSGEEGLDDFDAALAAHIDAPARLRETESAQITIEGQRDEVLAAGAHIRLTNTDENRLELVATVLAHSVVLSRDEILLTEAFDRIAPLVEELREDGRTRLPIRSAMRLVGGALAARHRVMGTVQADERPDLLWDHPELDRLYTRLEDEYELTERAEVLDRKFGALGDFTEVLLDIVQVKRAYRSEIAIIALITFEIALSLLTMFLR